MSGLEAGAVPDFVRAGVRKNIRPLRNPVFDCRRELTFETCATFSV